jgi:N-acetylneuraminate synthase
MSFSIAGRQIGPDCPPYVIAEVSCNHQGSLQRAFEIIRAAKVAGADAVKLQTFRPETHTLDISNDQFVIKGGLWSGRSFYELYSEAVTPWEWHAPLFEEARNLGITLFSSPGSEEAVDFLDSLGCPAYKIASFEAVDLPLIERVAQTGKPAIISTGLTGRDEIGEAVAAFRGAGGRDLALLHCVSAYPAPPEDFHLKTIAELSGVFETVAGLSDHTLGSAVAIAATALGASIIEKHVTLRRMDGGLDAAFSSEPEELRQLVEGCHTAWEAAGEAHFGTTRSSEPNRIFRRSIYVARDIAAGEALTARNLCIVRPGFGLPPKHWRDVLGRRASRALTRGTPLDWTAVTS